MVVSGSRKSSAVALGRKIAGGPIQAGKKEAAYVDAKGRRRWHRNDWVAGELKKLGDFLVIGGYEESHALRYGRLAHTISRYPQSVELLCREGRLHEIPGVGKTIATIISQYLETGDCTKKKEWSKQTPLTVLDIAAIPGIGAKTVRILYQRYGITSLNDLQRALDRGQLDDIKGIGKKTVERLRRALRGST